MRAHSSLSLNWSILDEIGAYDQRSKQRVRQKEGRTQQCHAASFGVPELEPDGQRRHGE